MDQFTIEAIDLQMMRRCIELSTKAAAEGEFPFASLISLRDGTVIAEATNRVMRDRDVTRHAELLAVAEAQRLLGRICLSDCMIYSNIEPCVMCSFPIRESGISRVGFSLRSPLMGGFSRWNVLGDNKISDHMPERFNPAPRLVTDLLAEEAEQVWKDWSLEIWSIIKERGCFQVWEQIHACLSPKDVKTRDRLIKIASPAHPGTRSRRRG